MSRTSKRIVFIVVAVAISGLGIAQYFGWLAGPPPLLAPGLQ